MNCVTEDSRPYWMADLLLLCGFAEVHLQEKRIKFVVPIAFLYPSRAKTKRSRKENVNKEPKTVPEMEHEAEPFVFLCVAFCNNSIP